MFDIVAIYTLQELVLSCPVTTVQGSQACLQHVKLYTTSTKQAINNTPTSTSGCFLIDAISLSLAMINSVSTKVSRLIVIHIICNSLKFIKMTRVEKSTRCSFSHFQHNSNQILWWITLYDVRVPEGCLG